MNVMGTDPIWGVTEGKLEEWWKEDEQSALQKVEPGSQATVVVVTGFVASTLQAWKSPPPAVCIPHRTNSIASTGHADDPEALRLRLLGDDLREAHARV